MSRPFITMLLIAGTMQLSADTIYVTDFTLSGPYPAVTPVMLDSTDVSGKNFDPQSALALKVPVGRNVHGTPFSGAVLPATDGPAVQVLTFSIDNADYARATLDVAGATPREVFVDGTKLNGKELELKPATHTVSIKYLSGVEAEDSVRVALDSPVALRVSGTVAPLRRLTLLDVLEGPRIASVEMSPSGKYLLTGYAHTEHGGRVWRDYVVTSAADGNELARYSDIAGWMPAADRLYRVAGPDENLRLVAVDPLTGSEDVITSGLPARNFTFSPAGDYIIYTEKHSAAPEKDSDVYEIVNPEDRLPGYRDRGQLMKFDLATGVASPVTFGSHDASLAGISSDGRKVLVRTSRQRFEERPTTLYSLVLIDLDTMQGHPVVVDDGFIGYAALSPDGEHVAVVASPESFGGIGKNLPEGMTPSMYDYQLYVVNVADGSVKPLTRDFNPSVESIEWSERDGNIYFTALNRDRVDLYRVDLVSGKITPLNALEENVAAFSLGRNSSRLAYYGQGADNSDRLYTLDLGRMRHTPVHDLSSERLEGIALGETHEWDFVSSRGDTISARYILPPDFDPSRKYPMIVNYYGGCSPTSRTFESRYPHHLYAANGYVVLCINPSGAAGFGQEHAARHVNTAGEGVAQDIIDGTVQFRDSHPWVDGSKIGCIGASYGGFMTQYLQTVTDIFAAAISHAGISDHTSYWGEGYWGYSYSEVSMAGSYPWSETDLYVKQSPLYRADKIHTPLLFLHGDHDTNVPYGESIQMFAALKLLGRPTALVAVKDANHQITDYTKRQKWQDTIFAWFARYLKDDPTWWEELYPEKNLE